VLILKDFKLLRINTYGSVDYKGVTAARDLSEPAWLIPPLVPRNEHRGNKNPQRNDGIPAVLKTLSPYSLTSILAPRQVSSRAISTAEKPGGYKGNDEGMFLSISLKRTPP
jgi:hypothetical protein